MSQQHYQPDDLLTIQEAAEFLGITRKWLYRLIRRHNIPVHHETTDYRLASSRVRFGDIQPLANRKTKPGPKPKSNDL